MCVYIYIYLCVCIYIVYKLDILMYVTQVENKFSP